LKYKIVPGSSGISSLLMGSGGHTIPFTVDGKAASVEIKRKGMTFTYQCFVDGELVPEMTSTVSASDKPVYSVSLHGAVTAMDWLENNITWYIVKTTRLEDGASTTVHRRFRDFAYLNFDVRRHFKGHHLLSSLPPFPEKFSKATTNHNDPAFIERRYVLNCERNWKRCEMQ
jgi:hypothetical protein